MTDTGLPGVLFGLLAVVCRPGLVMTDTGLPGMLFGLMTVVSCPRSGDDRHGSAGCAVWSADGGLLPQVW